MKKLSLKDFSEKMVSRVKKYFNTTLLFGIFSLLLTFAIFIQIFNQGVQFQKNSLNDVARHLAVTFDHELASRTASVISMSKMASDLLEERALFTFSADTSFTPVKKHQGYTLKFPSGYNTKQIGSLTGEGEIPTSTSDISKEIKMALALTSSFRAILNRYPDAPWVYYTSANNFSYVYPDPGMDKYFFTQKSFDYDVFRLATPQQNPRRTAFWTPPYLDEAGKGLIVSTAKPVYLKNEFKGILALDVSLNKLKEILEYFPLPDSTIHLIADNGQPLINPENWNQDIWLKDFESGSTTLVNKAYITLFQLKNVNWYIAIQTPRMALFKNAGLQSLVYVILALALLASIFLIAKLSSTLKKIRTLSINAEQASRAKSNFLANMSHEIRTPMNSVLGLAQIMSLDTQTTQKQRNYLNKIQLSGDHLLHIIDDILDFSQIDSEKLNIEKIEFNLDLVINKVLNMVQEPAMAKNIKLSFYCPHTISPFLIGDPFRLSQILLNFINNAIKFTEANGEIVIHTSEIASNDENILLHFEIQDTGIGISSDDITKLFQPFQQADSSITRKYGGSGLGLAISKRLAELMGGSVGVKSQLGKGSTFWFTAKFIKGYLPTISNSKRTEVTLKNAHILLVEDDLLNQEVATSFIHLAGANVSIANNGQEALEQLESQNFDCVLMDIQMPLMDGLETIRHIRSNPTFETLPVIAMTANASSLDRKGYLDAGMSDFISKPFKYDTLYAMLSKWLPQRLKTNTSIKPPIHSTQSEHTATALINFEDVAEFIGNDPEKMCDFVSRFIESTRDDIAKIESALRKNDLEEIKKLAHRMYTPAKMAGTKKVADLCRSLEQNIKQENEEFIQNKVHQLNALLTKIEHELNEKRPPQL